MSGKSAADRVLTDPHNHYPYKRQDALDAGWPEALVDASARVVSAQEAYLRDPSSENLQERNDAERDAQRLSSEMRSERLRFALQKQLDDLEAGNEGAVAGGGS